MNLCGVNFKKGLFEERCRAYLSIVVRRCAGNKVSSQSGAQCDATYLFPIDTCPHFRSITRSVNLYAGPNLSITALSLTGVRLTEHDGWDVVVAQQRVDEADLLRIWPYDL